MSAQLSAIGFDKLKTYGMEIIDFLRNGDRQSAKVGHKREAK